MNKYLKIAACFLAVFCACSMSPFPADNEKPPFDLPRIEGLSVIYKDNLPYLSFVNPYYSAAMPESINTAEFRYAITSNRFPLFTGACWSEMINPYDHAGDSLILVRIPWSAEYSADPKVIYYVAGVVYGYFSGPSSNRVQFPDSTYFIGQLKDTFMVAPFDTYAVRIYNSCFETYPKASDSMISSVQLIFQNASHGTLHLNLENHDSLFSTSATTSDIELFVDKVKANPSINDVCFILPAATVSQLYGRNYRIPGGYAAGSYFVITDYPSSFVFIHEMLHNVTQTSFLDLYNGYTAIEYPYVNALSGSVFGDQATTYIPKLFRAFLGWDSLQLSTLAAGDDTVVTVTAATQNNTANCQFWIETDDLGFSRFISLELVASATPDRGWQGPGLRVFEYFAKDHKRPLYLHAFPLDPAGEANLVRERIFCRNLQSWTDPCGRLPVQYAQVEQRGLSISVLEEFGAIDSMKVRIIMTTGESQ